MTHRLLSAAVLLAAMLATLLALFGLIRREFIPKAAQPVAPVHALRAPQGFPPIGFPHADLSGPACPAFPDGVSPRPTLRAQAVIRT